MAVYARQTAKLRFQSVSRLFGCSLWPGSVSSAASYPVKPLSTTSCCACQEKLPQAAEKPNFDPKFRNLYTFRYIVHTRVLSRLKIYQTLLTVVAIPPGIFMHNAGSLSTPSLASFFGIASLSTIMLYVMSSFFRHIVGIISINHSEEVVRISHLTFWGRRKDEEFCVSDIVPLSDMSVTPGDVFQVIQFYEKRKKFYWFRRHGEYTDFEAIERVFGKI